MLHFGITGYIESTKRIIQTARKIEEGYDYSVEKLAPSLTGILGYTEIIFSLRLRKVNGIHVMGNPQVSVVAFESSVFDVLRVSDALNKKGWSLNNLQFPSRYFL